MEWSSYVCSSDLIGARTAAEAVRRTVSAEHIVDSTADDVLDGDRLLGNAGSFHHAFRQVGLDHFPGIWEEEGVAAEAAFVAVDAKIAAPAVVSSAAAQQGVPGEPGRTRKEGVRGQRGEG